MKLWTRLNNAPHENYKSKGKHMVDFRGAMVAIWTDDFDCGYETEYWYCIKDTPLDLAKLKSKRRYEINKGNNHFVTKVINSNDYANELYSVYIESLRGYKQNPKPMSIIDFKSLLSSWNSEQCVLFGTFDKKTDKLCGFSDVWMFYPYLSISSFKTIPEYERFGVNFALVYEICRYFEEDIVKGAYLCDGARNSLHQTNFQNYLIKYFGFRRAYCKLHMAYRWYLKPFIVLLFRIRKVFKNRINAVYALLKMEAWSRGINEE